MVQIYLFDVLDLSREEFFDEVVDVAGHDVANQLKSVIVPVQMPRGDANDFSVLAFAYPGLTPEDKRDMTLVNEETYHVKMGGADIGIELDQFKMINWMHIRNSPNTYESLMAKIRLVVEAGGNKRYWEK